MGSIRTLGYEIFIIIFSLHQRCSVIQHAMLRGAECLNTGTYLTSGYLALCRTQREAKKNKNNITCKRKLFLLICEEI